MILQYCLSVYAINFFTQPPFKVLLAHLRLSKSE